MRVLVVDDHPPTIELMHLTLTAFGHTVVSATSVVEALGIVAVDRPDVILSDLTFSADETSCDGCDGRGGQVVPDGYALARAVRSDPTCDVVGLLAISGVTSSSELRAALRCGFDDVVVKPFDVGALIQRIESLASSPN